MGRTWYRLLEWGFRLLYNELAWTYDWVSWLVSRGQWRSWQLAALPFLAGRRVLEIAHGPGHMLLELERAGYEVYGADLSKAMIGIALRRIRRHGVAVTLIRGQAQALPFADGCFDSILSTFPAGFLVEQATIASVYRVLRPGGQLIVVPQARLGRTSLFNRFIEWLYAITGQRPVGSSTRESGFWEVVQEHYMGAGFRLEFQKVELATSEVTVVIATKPQPGPLEAPA